MSTILKANVVEYIARWIKINDQDDFTGRIYFTLREIYTVIRNYAQTEPPRNQTFNEGPPKKEVSLYHAFEEIKTTNARKLIEKEQLKND